MGPPRRRRLGIRARVVASFLLLLVVAELISLVVVGQVGARRIDQQATADLAVAAEDLRVRLVDVQGTLGRPGGPTLPEVFADHLRSRPARGDQAYLAFVDGRPTVGSAGAPVPLQDLAVAARWATLRTTETGEVDTRAGPVRWMAVPVVAGGRPLGVFVAAEFLRDQEDVLRGTLVTVSLVTGLVLVGASLLAWGAAGRALAPLRDLATTARSVSGSADLGARIDVTGRDEVGELATSFNGMLDDLQAAFDSQARFLDGAAHELRTPITIVRGHVELLDDATATADGRDGDPGERAAERAAEVALVLDEVDRMDRLVEELRLLARSERPDFLTTEEVDVGDLVAAIGRKASAMGPRRWVVRADAHAVVRADPQRLTQAVLNLVDNAVHVTTEEDTIEIGAGRTEGSAVLWVRDSGPGIPAADVGGIFDREGRTVRRRPGGTGLGLPLVAAIVRAHGGEVTAASDVGTGATFEIRLPVVAP